MLGEQLPSSSPLYLQTCMIEGLGTLVAHRLIGLERHWPRGTTGGLVSLGCSQLAVRAVHRGPALLLGQVWVSIKTIPGESQVPQEGLSFTHVCSTHFCCSRREWCHSGEGRSSWRGSGQARLGSRGGGTEGGTRLQPQADQHQHS